MGDLQSHQVVKLTGLQHFFHLCGQLEDLGVRLLHANLVEKVVEDITYHLDLLLRLQVVVDGADSRIAHLLVSPLSLKSLQVRQNRAHSIAERVKSLVH